MKPYQVIIVILGVILTFFAPVIFTHPYLGDWDFFNFSGNEAGNIGDSIGGITAPIIGLISILLLIWTLQEQISINKEQKKFNDATRILSIETFISEIESNISFGYSTATGVSGGQGLGAVTLLDKELFKDVGIAEGEFRSLFESIHSLDNTLCILYNLIMSDELNLEPSQKSLVIANLLIYFKKVRNFYSMVDSFKIDIFEIQSSNSNDKDEESLTCILNRNKELLKSIDKKIPICQNYLNNQSKPENK